MRVAFLFLLACVSSLVLPAQLSPKEAKWLRRQSAELGSPGKYDFSALDASLKGQRVVALGESSHGLGECYALKAALVQHLHQKLGYEVLAMEGGLGDINLAWADAGSLTVEELRDNTVFGNFRATEVQPLFDYLKAQHGTADPLAYTGFDTQASSEYFYRKLMAVLRPFDPAMADSVSTHQTHYGFWYRCAMQGDSVGYEYHKAQFMHKADAFSAVLASHREEILSQGMVGEREHLVMLRTLRCMASSVDLSYPERWNGVGLRDQVMAENLHWLIDTVFAGQKVVIWAHNAHIEQGALTNGYFKWMGHYLAEWYGNAYYSLGIFALEGNVYQHWTKATQPFDHRTTDCLESRLATAGRATCFLPLSLTARSKDNAWLWKPLDANEPENGGVVNFVPMQRFDGLVLIRHSDIPTY